MRAKKITRPGDIFESYVFVDFRILELE